MLFLVASACMGKKKKEEDTEPSVLIGIISAEIRNNRSRVTVVEKGLLNGINRAWTY